MTLDCDDWYSFTFSNINSTNLLFHDNSGGGNQTADLSRNTDGWYMDGQWFDTEPENCDNTGCTESLTIHFKKPNNWSVATIYYWGLTPAGTNANWPGEAMNDDGNGWYSYTIPCANCGNIIFSDNGANQTADLSRCNEGWYDGSWHDQNPDNGTGNSDLTVHFRPVSYSNPSIYFWNVTPTGESTSWPGVSMTDDGNGWYSYTFVNADCANFIFSNNGANQTADLSSCEEYWYDNGASGNGEASEELEAKIRLESFPNPAGASTEIRYELPEDAMVQLNVYNLSGQLVERLVDSHQGSGIYSIQLATEEFPNGLYIYRLQVGEVVKSNKLIVQH